MSQIESPRNPKFITALKADQVDWSLFIPHRQFAFQAIRNIEDVERQALTQTDFYKEAVDAREKVELGSKGYILDYKISSDLAEFLKKNRPPTLFFNPQDVVSLVTSDSKVKVKRKKEKDYER